MRKCSIRFIFLGEHTTKLLILMAVWILLSNSAKIYAGEIEEFPFLIVTTDEAPFQYRVNGTQRGDSIDILRAILKEANIETKIKFFPWARAYAMALKKKNVVIFSISRSATREKLFNWCCPLYKIKFKLFKLKKNNRIHIKTLEDAKKYRIAVWREDVRHQYLKTEGFSKFIVVNSDEQTIKLLMLGRTKVIPFNPSSLEFQMEKLGLDFNSVEPVWELKKMETYLYFAFNKDSDTKVVEKFVYGYSRVKNSKLYKDIYNRYDK